MTKYMKTIADKWIRTPRENAGATRPAEGRKHDAVAYAAVLEILG